MGFILLEAGYEDDHRVECLLEHPEQLAAEPRTLIKATAGAILRTVEESAGKEIHINDFRCLQDIQQQAVIDTRKEAFRKACLELGGNPEARDTWKHAWRDQEMLVPALVGVLVGCGWKIVPAEKVHSWPRRFCD